MVKIDNLNRNDIIFINKFISISQQIFLGRFGLAAKFNGFPEICILPFKL